MRISLRSGWALSIIAMALSGCGPLPFGSAQGKLQGQSNTPSLSNALGLTATENVVYSFAGGSDGANPATAPISVNGELYGTTATGGGGCKFAPGCGVIYTINASGQERVLHVFTSGKDGEAPNSLIAAGKNLFGTTAFGGGNGCKVSGRVEGCGAIFESSLSGKESVLYAFPGRAKGAVPNSLTPLDGTYYGEAAAGGIGKCYYTDIAGCGLIFKMRSGGHVNVIYTFKGGKQGGTPIGGLLPYKGSFFGTTEAGGHTACLYSYGCGTVFGMTPSGNVTILHLFGHTLHDGALPESGLALLNGAMYGTTNSGGTSDCALSGSFIGCGTIFQLARSGRGKVIYDFNGLQDGAYPNGLVAMGGNLYGTTQGDGAHRCGTVFELTPSGQVTTLYAFRGGNDGCGPASGLTEVGGTLYGTTEFGGTLGLGTVYSVMP